MKFPQNIFEISRYDERLACPNCWGTQEYEGCYREFQPDATKANINGDRLWRKAFVQQFVETNLTGIRLRNWLSR